MSEEKTQANGIYEKLKKAIYTRLYFAYLDYQAEEFLNSRGVPKEEAEG